MVVDCRSVVLDKNESSTKAEIVSLFRKQKELLGQRIEMKRKRLQDVSTKLKVKTNCCWAFHFFLRRQVNPNKQFKDICLCVCVCVCRSLLFILKNRT